ncbi:MAG: type II toxin-antitoxin system VapC family toxin [Bacillota bacterium]|jgi:predicted nucleic acid-binding protein
MVLVDTSVWVAHLRDGNSGLEKLLIKGHALTHAFIAGELACGNLRNRAEILSCLDALPKAVHAEHQEIMTFIENHRLMGKGLGYIDMHLLASAMLTNVPLWTLDKKMSETASLLGVSHTMNQ